VSKSAQSREKERSCIITRETGDAADMIRFVADPEKHIVPDIKGNLPGRGAWICGRRLLVEDAVKRKAFARALKAEVNASPDLPEQVDKLLAKAALANLSLARRSGAVITGAHKVDIAVRNKGDEVACVIHAAEAAEDSKRKLAQAVTYWTAVSQDNGKDEDIGQSAHKKNDKGIEILSPFTVEELHSAFGENNVVHIAVLKNRGSAGFIKAVNRLMLYRGAL